MSNTVDNRVVQMGFDNKGFESGVQQTVKSISTLKDGLNFEGSIKNLQNLDRAGRDFNLDNISSNVDKISNRFSVFGVVAFTVIQNITNSLINFGTNLAKTVLGINAMTQGMGGYETKINAVKTVMSATGEDLDTVMKSISDLNKYSDRTVYSFEDMTANISKFTNAGLSSKDAATAIQGISNVAAQSGANTNEAARAMYNFGQALSQGSVRLMDWKSIENANMATVEFKTQLLETAVALGTVKKEADGTYTTMAKKTPLTATKNFNDSLAQQWLTTDVLIKTLGDYASQETEIGKRANASATQLKTYTQLMDNMADALKTGWIKSFELILGNLDQATELFTYLGDTIGGVLQSSSDARNKVLQEWSDLGGRYVLFAALKNGIEDVRLVLLALTGAFKNVFPPITGKTIFNISIALSALAVKLRPTLVTVGKLSRIFTGLFAALDIVRMAIFSVLGLFGDLLGILVKKIPGGGILEFLADIGDYIVQLRQGIIVNNTFSKAMERVKTFLIAAKDSIVEFVNVMRAKFEEAKKKVEEIKASFAELFSKVDTSGLRSLFKGINIDLSGLKKTSEGAQGTLDKLKETISKIAPTVKSIGARIVTFVTGVANTIAGWISRVDWGKIFKGFTAGLFTTILLGITKLVSSVNKLLGGGSWTKIISGLVDALSTNFTKIFKSLGSGLSASLLISFKKFISGASKAISSDKGIFGSIAGTLNNVRSSLEAWQQNLKSKTLINLAVAVGILAASLLVLSNIDQNKLLVSMGAITGLFVDLTGAMAIYSKSVGSTGGVGGAVSLVAFTLGILVLAGAVSKLGQLDQKALTQGVIAISTLSLNIIVVSKLLSSNNKSILKGAGNLILFAVAMMGFAVAIRMIGSVKPEELTRGLIGLGAILGELVIFLKLADLDKMGAIKSVGLVLLAGSLMLMAIAIGKFGKMDVGALQQGLIVIGSVLAELALFSKMSGSGANLLATSVGIAVLGGAMLIFVDVIKQLGNLDLGVIEKGLGAMSATLLVLAVALNAMTGTLMGSAALLVAAAALVILMVPIKALGAMDLAQVGTALLVLAGVFLVLGIAGYALAPVVPVLFALGGALLLFGTAAALTGVGLLAFSAGLTAIALSGAGAAMAITAIIMSIVSLLPIVVGALIKALVQFAQGLTASTPVFGKAISGFVSQFLDIIIETTPKILKAFGVILDGLIQVVTNDVPSIVEALLTLLVTLIQTIADKVPDFIQSGMDILLGFLKGILDNIEEIATTAIAIVTKFIDTVASKLPDIIDSGFNLIVQFINGLADGVEKNGPELQAAIGNLTSAIIEGFTNGILAGTGSVISAISKLAGAAVGALKTLLGIASPSKVFTKLGEFSSMGFVKGLLALGNQVVAATKSVGKKAIDGMSSAISSIRDSLETDLDMNPTIRPVVDMSDVISSGKILDDALGQKYVNLSPAVQAASSVAGGFYTGVNPNSENVPSTGNNISLIQNNYSPKALSAIDIYRQTKTQLLTLKGLVNPS